MNRTSVLQRIKKQLDIIEAAMNKTELAVVVVDLSKGYDPFKDRDELKEYAKNHLVIVLPDYSKQETTHTEAHEN